MKHLCKKNTESYWLMSRKEGAKVKARKLASQEAHAFGIKWQK